MKCSLLGLSSYLDGELDAGKRGELEAHLVGCQRCTGGLGHLREEVQRIAGLAPVHVPDQSARALMEQLGLITPGEALPQRSAPRVQMPSSPSLPWLQPETGKALPWRAARGPVTPPATLPGPGTLNAAPIPPAPAPEPPRPAPPTSPPAWLSMSPPATADLATSPSPAPPVQRAPLPPQSARPPAEPPLPEAPSRRPAPLPAAPVLPPAPSSAPRQPVGKVQPPLAPVAPINPAPIPLAPIPPAPAVPVNERAVTSAEGSRAGPEPAWTPVLPAPAPAPEPVRAATPAESGVERAPVGKPEPWPADQPAPPRHGLLDRVRERLAVQRALSRSSSEVDDGLEPAPAASSRSWARRREQSAVGMGVEVEVPRAPVVDPWPRPEWARNVDDTPAPALEKAREAARRRAEAARARPAPGRHRGALEARQHARSGRPEGEGGGRPSTLDRLRDLVEQGTHSRGLLIFAGALTVLILFAVIRGHSAAPIPSELQGSARLRPPAASAPASAAPLIPPVPSAAPAGTVPVQLNDVRNLGSGTAGASIKGIRYGNHPGSFYRVVVDVLPGADGAAPKTTVGFKDPTTLWVVFDGAAPPASVDHPADGGPISAVKQVTPAPQGKTVIEFKLTRPVNLTNVYLSGPLRLVLDLS